MRTADSRVAEGSAPRTVPLDAHDPRLQRGQSRITYSCFLVSACSVPGSCDAPHPLTRVAGRRNDFKARMVGNLLRTASAHCLYSCVRLTLPQARPPSTALRP